MAGHPRGDGDGGEGGGVRPPRWKLMIVSWMGLFPPLVGIAYAAQALFPRTPLWARLLGESLLLVPLINLVLNPTLEKLFEGWLYPEGAPKAPEADS